MGIDGIGKPPIPPTGVGGPTGVSGTTGATSEFRVERATSVVASGSVELERLSRGEISLGEYLDARVTEATAHLKGKLSPEQIEFVQGTLRAELETDPRLVSLVQQVTGSAASAVEK